MFDTELLIGIFVYSVSSIVVLLWYYCGNCTTASLFSNRIINVSNSLPPSVVDFSSLGKFRKSLALVDLSKCLRCDCCWQFKHFIYCIVLVYSLSCYFIYMSLIRINCRQLKTEKMSIKTSLKHYSYTMVLQTEINYIHRLLWIVVSAMLWPYQSCSCRTVDNLSRCCALSERIKMDTCR